jgi:hypothetical protein
LRRHRCLRPIDAHALYDADDRRRSGEISDDLAERISLAKEQPGSDVIDDDDGWRTQAIRRL